MPTDRELLSTLTEAAFALLEASHRLGGRRWNHFDAASDCDAAFDRCLEALKDHGEYVAVEELTRRRIELEEASEAEERERRRLDDDWEGFDD